MGTSDKGRGSGGSRRYHSPSRTLAAARTREAILRAAKSRFEHVGWAGATIPAIAEAAGVSPKTVEAVFRTKASLLAAVVDFAIRGDASQVPMPRCAQVAEMEAAGTAATMLDLHAAHVRSVNQRSARIAWVVEHAAEADPVAGELWRQMLHNRRFGVAWAASTLLAKQDVRRDLVRTDAERVFLLALDWGTYRTLTAEGGLTPERFETWLRGYYRAMLE